MRTWRDLLFGFIYLVALMPASVGQPAEIRVSEVFEDAIACERARAAETHVMWVSPKCVNEFEAPYEERTPKGWRFS